MLVAKPTIPERIIPITYSGTLLVYHRAGGYCG
jgi:hypothetical protein